MGSPWTAVSSRASLQVVFPFRNTYLFHCDPIHGLQEDTFSNGLSVGWRGILAQELGSPHSRSPPLPLLSVQRRSSHRSPHRPLAMRCLPSLPQDAPEVRRRHLGCGAQLCPAVGLLGLDGASTGQPQHHLMSSCAMPLMPEHWYLCPVEPSKKLGYLCVHCPVCQTVRAVSIDSMISLSHVWKNRIMDLKSYGISFKNIFCMIALVMFSLKVVYMWLV